MAWKRDKKSGKPDPQKELDDYKKDIGKQYMNGLLSEKEYEDLLFKKTNELGLASAPQPKKEGGSLECPICRAHVDAKDTECKICGSELIPIMDNMETKTPDIPEIEQNRICGGCGSVVSILDTICSVCGGMLPPAETDILGTIPETKPAPEISAEETPVDSPEPTPEAPAEERVCPSCGAFVEADATECMICETPMAIAAIIVEKAPEPEITEEKIPEPVEESAAPAEEIPEDIPEPPEIPPTEEKVCPSCGAFVEPDATECMMCDTPIAVASITVEKVPEPEIPEEKFPEAVEEEPAVPMEEIPEEVPEPVPEISVEEKICPSCGAFAGPDDTVCLICDTPLGEEAVPAKMDDFTDLEPAPMPTNEDIVIEVEEPALEEAAPEPEIIVEERQIEDDRITCPSCGKAIPADAKTCPECWTDLSLYVKCPSCLMFTPAGEKLCRECFAPLGELSEEEPEPEFIIEEGAMADINIPDEVIITEELREEMTILETQEEQGKECLVCGAIFGPEDMLCPVCGIEYGVEVEEPKVPETVWDVLEVEVPPTIRTCPNCGSNVTGLDATEREINEGRWFYRGLVTIFVGIFFTSFSIYARGISAENSSLGLHPPPTDVVLNVLGWVLVLIGFTFWVLSYRLHGQRTECPDCGVETEPNVEKCINCGVDLGEQEDEYSEDAGTVEQVDEDMLPKEDKNYLDKLDLPARRHADMPVRKQEPIKEIPPEPEMDEIEETIPELEIPEEAEMPEPEMHVPGEELPVEHEEHKKCPGCGIFVDMGEKVCPVCDTEFAVENPEPMDEDFADLEPQGEAPEASIDNITIPDIAAPRVECPSCGADLAAGTKSCPVCEYPLE